ncbi:MAG: thioredoxin family protein [Hylemonella sp.]|uniref:thioredoxin family protein n=1 Tax=Hylemonella sp. TaxID=2066020 RepID=UPI00391D6E33
MLKQLLASLIVGATLLAGAQAATVGQPAPDFTLQDVNGKTVRLSDYRGRPVVLEWNNPGCPFVRKHYDSGNMQTLQREAAAKNVVWLAINSTEASHDDYLPPAQLGRWMSEQKAAPTATLMDEDGTVGRAYAARVTPHMYIVDAQGRLAYAGAIDSIPSGRTEDIKTAINYVRTGLGEALAGKPLSQPSTRPYGCTIKYH